MKRIKKAEKTGSWAGFFRMVRQINLPWLVLLIAFAFEMLYSQATLMLPTTTTALMSGSLEASALRDAIIYYILYALVLLADFGFLGISRNWTIRNARNKVWGEMVRIRTDYYDRNTPTALTSAITNDLEAGVGGLARLIVSVTPTIYYIVAALFVIGDFDRLLLIPILILLPVKYVYMVVVSRWMYKAQVGIYQRIGVLTGYLGERVKNLPLIKQFCTEKEEHKNGQAASKDLFDARMHSTKVTCADSGIATAINLLQHMGNIIFGAILLQQGRITAADWVAFFLFSSTINARFGDLIHTWQEIKTIQGQAARVVDIVEAPKEQTEAEASETANAVSDTGAAPAVSFRNVSFSYGEKQALKNVSFTVPAGSAVAIVGLTGSGKTTMLNLLERFYEAGEGSVMIGDRDVKELSLGQLRSRYSFVQQDAGVFSGSVREAMTYGIRRDLTDEEIITAAQNAGAWDLIQKIPGGLDTKITADGASLSGGQRQRLVLAREFLRNADVLLLDEPTSALDAKTAQTVKQTIFRLFRGKTMLMVTHDMTLVSDMDQIVVLHDGEVVGQGTYDQVLADCSLFREMVEAQQKEVQQV